MLTPSSVRTPSAEGNVFYSDQHTTFQDDEDRQTRNNAQRKFIDFLRNFRGLPQRGNPDGMLVYRDMLDQDPAPASLSVSLDDIIAHDKELGKAVKEHPGDYLPLARTLLLPGRPGLGRLRRACPAASRFAARGGRCGRGAVDSGGEAGGRRAGAASYTMYAKLL